MVGGGIGGLGGGKSLFDPVEYADYNKLLENFSDKFGKIKDYVEAIGIFLAGWKIADTVLSFFNKLFDWGLTEGEILLKGLGVGLILGGVYLTYKGMKKILDGELTAENILEVLTGNIAIVGGVMALTGGNLRLGIGVSIAIDSLFAEYSGMKGLVKGEFSWENVFKTIGGALGVGLAVLVAGGTLSIAGGAIVLSLAASFAFASLPSFDEIKQSFETVRQGIVDWWNNAETSEKLSQVGKYIILGIGAGIITAFLGIPGLIASMFIIFINAIGDAFGISSPAKEMMPYGEYIILGLLEGIKSLFNNVIEIFIDLKDQIINKIIELINDLKNKVTEMKNNITNKFIEIKDNVVNKITEIKTNVTNKFNDIKNTIKTKIEDARDIVKNAINKIKSFFNFKWKLPDIKMPHFGIEWDTSGMVGSAFKKLGMPGLPKLKVDWYAEGGFPDKGQLFIANEREPELIGSMGNRSVVANNRQIIEGIAEATYGAFRQALSEMGENFGGDTLVYVGDTQITDVITKKKRIQDKRFGR